MEKPNFASGTLTVPNHPKVHQSSLSLRELLKGELARRCQKNPRYSLRSFAKSLELSPAFVSKLLKGDRGFTERTFSLIAQKLALDPEQQAYYLQKIRSGHREVGPEPVYRQISLDQFQMIADWYHNAILEITTLHDFESDPQWIAKRLNLNVHQVSDAIERLMRLNCLYRDESGRLRLVSENNTIVGPEVAMPATRRNQQQILEMATQAMVDTPIEVRSQTAVTMALPVDRLGEAKAIITEFRRRLTDLMQRPGARDEVYQLSISFFPLTKSNKEN